MIRSVYDIAREVHESNVYQFKEVAYIGKDISVDGTYDDAPCRLSVFGQSAQEDVPTPEYPYDIASLADPKVALCGKNLFDLDSAAASLKVSKDGNGFTTKQWSATVLNNSWVRQNLEPDTLYTIQFKATIMDRPADYPLEHTSAIGFVLGDTAGRGASNILRETNTFVKYQVGDTFRTTIQFTTEPWILDSDVNCVLMIYTELFKNQDGIYHIPNSAGTVRFDDIQIERGNMATGYVSYQRPVSITLPYTLRSIPDGQSGFAARDYVEVSGGRVTLVRECGEKTLDGTENWSLYASHEKHFQMYVGDNAYGTQLNPVLSSHYEANKATGAYYSNKDYAVMSVDGDRIRIKDIRFDDVSDFKAYLAAQHTAQTPVTVQYALKSPVIANITDTETGQALLALRTYWPYTRIYSDADMKVIVKQAGNTFELSANNLKI